MLRLPSITEPTMNLKLVLLILVYLAFGALSIETMLAHGYWGIFQYQFGSLAGWQVLGDLVISCSLISLWMIVDARRQGRNAWPYVLLTLLAGSFGPLTYLLAGELQRRVQQQALA